MNYLDMLSGLPRWILSLLCRTSQDEISWFLLGCVSVNNVAQRGCHFWLCTNPDGIQFLFMFFVTWRINIWNAFVMYTCKFCDKVFTINCKGVRSSGRSRGPQNWTVRAETLIGECFMQNLNKMEPKWGGKTSCWKNTAYSFKYTCRTANIWRMSRQVLFWVKLSDLRVHQHRRDIS
jgi:hypothetical protein